MADQARILVSVDTSSAGGTSGVASALRAAGVTVTDVLEEIGTISAVCPAEALAAVARIPGVLSVEPERKVSIPSPGSRIQ